MLGDFFEEVFMEVGKSILPTIDLEIINKNCKNHTLTVEIDYKFLNEDGGEE